MSSNRCARIYNAIFLTLAFAVLVFAMFPGRFDGDSIGQYHQGLSFGFDDSHSVLNALMLGLLSDIAKGPGPMFVMQLALWIGGLLIFTDTLIAADYPVAGQLISILALTPLLSFDFFDIQKDTLFSGLLAVLLGLATRTLFRRLAITPIGAITTFCLLIFTLDTRPNAIFALVPLWLLVWPIYRVNARALLISAAVGLVIFISAFSSISLINNDILKTNQSHQIYSLIIFDLAGISARTGQDASHGLLPDFQANVATCYTAREWDAFLGGPCSAVGLAAQKLVHDDAARSALMSRWLKEIALHPIAYLAHRARNFDCLIRVGCYDVSDMSAGFGHRPWDEPDMRITVAVRVIAAIGWNLWRGPFGYGILWIAVLTAEFSVSAFLLRRRGFQPIPYLNMILAAAGLGYVLSFAIAGVADQLRYLHPVFFLAIIGIPLAAASLLNRRPSRP
jgi:hypothetical protein